ncbi:D-glycero-beta-D-manno-heptose-7-phosphate kinase [bacterium]|nr:D-glycero-beta-D-manno-heptose-7-phosphate kinase [bacterium]
MISRERFLETIKNFPHRNILVVGDLIIDRYFWGNVSRISPEAPVPVVEVERQENRAGGAANVAMNLAGLGANVYLAGVVGDDGGKEILAATLAGGGGNISGDFFVGENHRPTTIKTRIIGHSQQIVRFDMERDGPIAASTRNEIVDRISRRAREFHAIVVSDYAKGVISRVLIDRLKEIARDNRIPIAVDPRLQHANFYKGVDLITPNHIEAGQFLGIELRNEDGAVESAGAKILKRWNLKNLLITRAGLGMTSFEPGRKPRHIPTVARQVYDVTGAGDSVIAAVVLARAAGATWEEAASIANHAAGIVVGKIGTVPVTIRELRDYMRRRSAV